MTSVVPFNFEDTEVRVVSIDGEPWFVGKDVASVLGYSNAADAVRRHCKGAAFHDTLTEGGMQKVRLIPERDVYRLVMRSKLPSAERFEEWVVGDVLPVIRKTGRYAIDHVGQDAKQSLPTPIETEQQLAALKRVMMDEELKSSAPLVWQHLSDALQNQALAFLGVQNALPSPGKPSLLDIVEIAKRSGIDLPANLRGAAGKYVKARVESVQVERVINGSTRHASAYADHAAVAQALSEYLARRVVGA